MVDTNIWIDLHFGGLLAEFLRLPFEFVCPDAIIEELQTPSGRKLVRQGVVELTLGPGSVRRVAELVDRHPKPQLNDLFALVLAIELDAVLATGNEHLRQAAIAEGVRVVRTLGILQMLVDEQIIDRERAATALEAILAKGDRWLPAVECQRCLERWRGS